MSARPGTAEASSSADRGNGGQRAGTIPAGAGSSRTATRTRRATRDHPRGCGEQGTGAIEHQAGEGPSPRVRGADAVRLRRRRPLGTIPAGARSSSGNRVPVRSSGDHPRGCGEQYGGGPRAWPWWGPSPRVRGAGSSRWWCLRQAGTIPAGAGSSRWRSPTTHRTRDHPRGCGEQQPAWITGSSMEGPSPRVRGAGGRLSISTPDDGTIPAGAGSSRTPRTQRRPPRDHPRGCGEQTVLAGAAVHVLGPSPRVRGAVARALTDQPHLGTIPAGAGSSPSSPLRPALSWDHLRGRGEQSSFVRPPFGSSGPSPRARGAVKLAYLALITTGTIPAGAGSRCRAARTAAAPRDHPRGRGEQWAENGRMTQAEGPSPRVRGADTLRKPVEVRVGTIPAGAGSRHRRRPRCWWGRDHPRGCGEQPTVAELRRLGTGPSPRVRGAGAAWRSVRRPRDHPRGCGEQDATIRPSDRGGGPSPRVRGADEKAGGPLLSRGTIPAGAGSRKFVATVPSMRRDHPRGCGEQSPSAMALTLASGPSPRVRGAVEGERAGAAVVGTIPAGAGSRSRSAPRRSSAGDHPRGCGEQRRLMGMEVAAEGPSPRVRGAVDDEDDDA